MTIRPESDASCNNIINYIENYKIVTPLLFAGNLTTQPYMLGGNFRISADLTKTDLEKWLRKFEQLR